MSSRSVSTSSEVCIHLSAVLIVTFYQVPLIVEHSFIYSVKSRNHRTHLDGKQKSDYLILKTFEIGCGLL